MGLPRKKLREQRRANKSERMDAKQEMKLTRIEKRTENIEKGESLGFKIGDAAGKAAEGFANMIGGDAVNPPAAAAAPAGSLIPGIPNALLILGGLAAAAAYAAKVL